MMLNPSPTKKSTVFIYTVTKRYRGGIGERSGTPEIIYKGSNDIEALETARDAHDAEYEVMVAVEKKVRA